MKFVLMFMALSLSFSSAQAIEKARELYRCELDEPSRAMGAITISALGNDHFMGIEWLLPVGGEDIEEVLATEISDHTVNGYDAPSLNARLMFYTEDDLYGERNVLEFEGRELAVTCVWVGK